jgi:dTDP-4-dehydrorhamnose reductase
VRISLTGHDGRLGVALQAELAEHELQLLEGDIRDYENIRQQVVDFAPNVVINSAALTQVDYCAEHPREALAVNGFGAQNVALAAQHVGALMVQVSTNEVFDGQSRRPYWEYDTPNPINSYGYSKYVGEQTVQQAAERALIVRTAWLFAPGGVNFIHKVLARAEEGKPLVGVVNEIGSPTYTIDLAEAIHKLIVIGRPGVYHMANAGVCSRYEFAREVLEQAGHTDLYVEPVTGDRFKRASTPPPFTPLENIFGAQLGVTMRPWQEALAAYLEEHG